ncbi:hypothetical protein K431DRAFT_234009 [Polychaeton citri CBS 116435]|uniref:Mg2+ transporter protein n=1 Tax=Polychaeton citri CBS 116435 TaxID=1314669 RepID=A0A9P4UK32_9PEZI|nr:hypothetical protein K431DRAFT_234009 [Polychaeton citri CBS 116435]
MPRRRRHHTRYDPSEWDEPSVSIRIGSRSASRQYHYLHATGPRDSVRFNRLIEDELQAGQDPLIISIAGHQPWLEQVLSPVVGRYWSDVSNLNRETQFASTMQFPERCERRIKGGAPWTFLMNQMNMPSVFYWSVGYDAPQQQDDILPPIDHYRFRTGVWFCPYGACALSPETAVYLIFSQPIEVDELIASQIMFPYLYDDDELNRIHCDEEGVCWIFLRLFELLTDWQNIIHVVRSRLEQAEINSHGRHLPVKIRTRRLHSSVDRCYELDEFLHYQLRALRKLQKLKNSVPKNEQSNPIWDDVDDFADDLEQYDATISGLKERFDNLIELEFNISNATQSDNSTFLSIIATIFLPISYLASLFGITTVSWPVIWYVWAAIPVVVFSLILIIIHPWAVKRWQTVRYPYEERRLTLTKHEFSMLGDELPGAVDVPGGDRSMKARRAHQNAHRDRTAPRPRSQSRRPSEKA